MKLFSERNNLRKPAKMTEEISINAYESILTCCEKYYNNLAWKYPSPSWHYEPCYGLELKPFQKEIKELIFNLFRNDNGLIATPTEGLEYDQYALLDFIEFIAYYCRDIREYYQDPYNAYYSLLETDNVFKSFHRDINRLFNDHGLLYKLTENKQIERLITHSVLSEDIENEISLITEKGIKELLEESISLFRQPHPNSKQTAIEKLWDALERLKTYYDKDKTKSANQIIDDMSNGNSDYFTLFYTEFKLLSKIGNDYRIRHHETNKIEISDPNYYDYFFNRCLSLIALAIKYLK